MKNLKQNIMNKKSFSLLAGMAMVVAGFAFASCSSNDDDIKNPTVNATEAYARPVIIVSDKMLDVYDVTCNIDGNTVTVTKDNTVAIGDTIVDKTTYSMRKYVGAAKTYTQFPSYPTFVEHIKVKDGMDLRTVDKTSLVRYAYYDYTNNSALHEVTGVSGSIFTTFTTMIGSKMSESSAKTFSDMTVQINDTLKSANFIGRSYKLGYANK